jgi:hypothetical protein
MTFRPVVGQGSSVVTANVAPLSLLLTNVGSPLAYAGQAFTQPFVAHIGGCAFPPGTSVVFSSIPPGLVITPQIALTDALGDAAVVVSAPTSTAGAFVVRASFGGIDSDRAVYVRALTVTSTPTTIDVTYVHEHAFVPLILAADAATAVPYATTPWGAVWTSILNPLPTLGVLDGLGLFGAVDAALVTGADGIYAHSFTRPPPLGLSFVLQVYGYDANAAFPREYIVTNPVTIML